MAPPKHQNASVEYDTDGKNTTYLYQGTRTEMEDLAASCRIGDAGSDGVLERIRLGRKEGAVWECELRYGAANDWDSVTAPPREWGAKSCRLRGALLSRPLEEHPDYRMKWDHLLAAAPGTNSVPAWWSSAASAVIAGADAERYCWCKSPSELPVDSGGRWRTLCAPTKPGVTGYTVAVYTVTETARFRSASAAGRMVANTLNRLGAPETNFDISGGNWKCDDAEVSWNGSCWLARLTWTFGGADRGWDNDIYRDN